MINYHNCSQICVEVEGSFNCSCYPGYELQEDEVTCTGIFHCKFDISTELLESQLSYYVTRVSILLLNIRIALKCMASVTLPVIASLKKLYTKNPTDNAA